MSVEYNQKMQFPTGDRFVNRITFVEFTDSKNSGNPMIHFTAEVVSPDEVEIGGKMVNIAGVQTEQYYTVTTFKMEDGNRVIDEEKTKANRERILGTDPDNLGLFPLLGLPVEGFNPENPDVQQLKGLVFMSAMGSKVEPQRKSATEEQRAKGITKGDVMTHPITGKELVFYTPNIKQIFCIAPSSVASKATAKKPY